MDAQNTADHHPEPVPETPALLAAPDTKLLAPPALHEVSDNDFEEVVRGALEAVGGTLLFKVKVGADSEAHHAAAAAVGLGDSRQFLLLTLPAQAAASSRSRRRRTATARWRGSPSPMPD